METKPASWQEHFSLTVCPATAIDREIAPTALGVAVIYAKTSAGEQIFLVIESRAGALLTQCNKRLQTAKLPPLDTLTIAFKAETLPEATPEAIHAACREQVIFASELRRELRPAMR
jgi:hypothetical protein